MSSGPRSTPRADAEASARSHSFQRVVRGLTPSSVFGAAFAFLYVPTLFRLFETTWREDSNGHGPIVMGIAAWLLWQRLAGSAVSASGSDGSKRVGWTLLTVGLILFGLARSMSIISIETFSAIWVASAGVVLFGGLPAFRRAWFPLLFIGFAVPLPAEVVDTVTGPMKIGVSWAAEHLLYSLGYPVARQGVILQVGPYQLLVADACSGLQTLLTLEALGLLYINLTQHASWVRNAALATLIVPISLVANVIRVVVLILVTFHLGDEAGQGFLHDFAGMVLFLAGLVLIIGVDALIRMAVRPSMNASAS
jgi:exosortase B